MRHLLRPYQIESLDFLHSRKNSGLFLPTGSGKTLVMLTFCEGIEAKRVLYVCPASIKYSVRQEILKHLPEASIQVIDGPSLLRKKQWRSRARYTIVNYECVLKDRMIMPTEWEVLLLDEAQKVKNPRAKVTRVIHHLSALRKVLATATPIMNKPEDLWSLAELISPGVLGNFFSFKFRYCVTNKWHSIVGYRDLDHLHDRVKHLYIKREKREIMADLPPLTIAELLVELSAPERKLYDSVKKELLHELRDADFTAPLASLQNAVTKLLRLRQICCTSSIVKEISEESAKIAALKDKLEELEGEKVVVFCSFVEAIKVLAPALEQAGHKVIVFTGEMNAWDKIKAITAFSKSDANIFLSSDAGSVGVNLQVASHLINFDLPWSYGQYLQRIGRIERIGQTAPMFVYNLIARKTVDQYIAKMLARKESMANIIVDSENLSLTIGKIVEILE